MKELKQHVKIFKLSLQAAIACNLQCKYCIVSKNSNIPFLKELQQKTNTALTDGSYLSNVKKALQRLEQNQGDITRFEIWGQEPTLVLPYLTPKISDWCNEFPNLELIMFSTNGMHENWSDIIYNFAKEMDKSVKKKTRLEIQVSYDSITEDASRGGSEEILKNNLKLLFEKINNTYFNNIEIHIYTHAVISTQLIDLVLQDSNNINKYFDNIELFYNFLISNSLNKSVKIGPITTQYMNGSLASTEDGLRFNECCERIERFLMCNKEKYNYFKNFPLDIDFGANSLGCVVHSMPEKIRHANCNNLEEYVNAFFDNHPKTFYVTASEYCGACIHDLKIMYDGTSISCQNFLFDAYINQNKKKHIYQDNIKDQSTLFAMTNNTQCVNLLTASDEEIRKQLYWGIISTKENNMAAMTNGIANMMYLMAQTGQISNTYLMDLDKIKRHAFILAALECCYYNLTIATGSSAIHPISQIRYLCNGLMDKAENMINIVLNREGRVPTQNNG